MDKPPTPPDDGHAAAKAPPNALQVLAELELMRRKSDLLERRVAAWESDLVEVRKVLALLEKERDPAAPEWKASLDELSHRVGRLERRREAAAETPPPPSPVLSRRPTGGAGLISDVDAVAIVRARWSPPEARPGDAVELLATCDGIDAGTDVRFAVRSLVEDAPVAELGGKSDGDVLRARWKVPKPAPASELYFEVEHSGAVARSAVLVLPAEKT